MDFPGPPVRRLTLFFCHKKANILKKITAKVSGQLELRISIYTRNRARRERRNRERQRDRSNLGGALAPPTPWRPWTRGETLLPSREKVKEEEEEGGGSLPLASGGAGALPGPSSSPPSSPTTSPPSSPTLPLSMQRCNLSLILCNLYLNMVLNAIYFFPMMYGYLMMFE